MEHLITISTLVSTALFIIASVISRVIPGTVFKLGEVLFIVALCIRLRHVGFITIDQPSFTSFNSGLLQGGLIDETCLSQLSNHLYSSLDKDPL